MVCTTNGGGGGLGTNHNFWSKKNDLLFLSRFDPEAFKTYNNTKLFECSAISRGFQIKTKTLWNIPPKNITYLTSPLNKLCCQRQNVGDMRPFKEFYEQRIRIRLPLGSSATLTSGQPFSLQCAINLNFNMFSSPSSVADSIVHL